MSGCEVAQKVKYLGVELTNKNLRLLKNKYEKMWKKIDEDLIKWNQQNLLLLGRIATIKMNVLPPILYLFQTISIVKKQCIVHWKREITNVIWAGKNLE